MRDTQSNKLSRRYALSAALGGMTWACHQQSSHPAEPVHIALSSATALIHLPLWLAQELGYFRQEGLAISLDDAKGGSKAAEALMAGSANIASAAFEQAVVLNQQGRECLVFWLLFDAPDFTLFGSPVSRPAVRKLNDLVGRTVGVSTVGSTLQKEVEYALRRQNLPSDKVTFVMTPNQSARIAGLRTGRLDAAIMGEPGASLVRQQLPSAPILADFSDPERLQDLLGTKVYPGNALFSTAPWVKRNAGAVHKLTRALSRATQWAKSQTPAEIVRTLPRSLQLENAGITEKAIGNMLPHMSLTGRTPPEAAEAVARLMGIQAGINRSYTNDFVSALSR